jgi:hypothetical protein
MGDGFGFDRMFVWSLRLGGDVGWLILVASSGLASGLDHGGHQMLGSNSRSLLDPKHGVKVRRWVTVHWRIMATKMSTTPWVVVNAL